MGLLQQKKKEKKKTVEASASLKMRLLVVTDGHSPRLHPPRFHDTQNQISSMARCTASLYNQDQHYELDVNTPFPLIKLIYRKVKQLAQD